MRLRRLGIRIAVILGIVLFMAANKAVAGFRALRRLAPAAHCSKRGYTEGLGKDCGGSSRRADARTGTGCPFH
jgi:hypothetical protein